MSTAKPRAKSGGRRVRAGQVWVLNGASRLAVVASFARSLLWVFLERPVYRTLERAAAEGRWETILNVRALLKPLLVSLNEEVAAEEIARELIRDGFAAQAGRVETERLNMREQAVAVVVSWRVPGEVGTLFLDEEDLA